MKRLIVLNSGHVIAIVPRVIVMGVCTGTCFKVNT